MEYQTDSESSISDLLEDLENEESDKISFVYEGGEDQDHHDPFVDNLNKAIEEIDEADENQVIEVSETIELPDVEISGGNDDEKITFIQLNDNDNIQPNKIIKWEKLREKVNPQYLITMKNT
jgi:hypothetical protein